MSDPIEIVRRAIELSEDEDYTGALNLLTDAIAADSTNAQAYFERGIALMNLDRDADAVADFDRALTIDPQFPGALDWRSRAHATLGSHRQAAEDRLRDLRNRPDGPHQGLGVSPQKWADCAQAFIDAGEPQRARELLEEYFADHVGRVTSYARFETAPMRILAKLLIQAGEPDRACEFARQAHASNHQCPADILVFALALEAVADLDAARRVCAEAVQANDQMPGVLELRSRLAD